MILFISFFIFSTSLFCIIAERLRKEEKNQKGTSLEQIIHEITLHFDRCLSRAFSQKGGWLYELTD